MSEFLLLRDKHHCPQCRARRSFSGGHCANCGMRLFINPINFQAYEDDGHPRRYWLWTNDRGWIYRDYVMDLRANPQARVLEITTPDRNTEEFQRQRLADVRRDTNEKVRRITPKRNQFGYGKSKTSISMMYKKNGMTP